MHTQTNLHPDASSKFGVTWVTDHDRIAKTGPYARLVIESDNGAQRGVVFLEPAQLFALRGTLDDACEAAPSEPCAYAPSGRLMPWETPEPEHDHQACLDADAAEDEASATADAADLANDDGAVADDLWDEHKDALAGAQ